MSRQPWRKSRHYEIIRPIYTKSCCLCGARTEFKRRVWIKTLLGWKQTQGYVCIPCATYWMKEANAARIAEEKIG